MCLLFSFLPSAKEASSKSSSHKKVVNKRQYEKQDYQINNYCHELDKVAVKRGVFGIAYDTGADADASEYARSAYAASSFVSFMCVFFHG